MNFSAPAIRRPKATILLTIGLVLAGAVGFSVLPVSPLPQVDSPTLFVQANLPGASPEVMAAAVATPLERQLGHIADVTEMTSQSSTGSTSISLQFDLDRNINAAARDVQAAISAARTYLPTNMPSNPTYRKFNSSDAPIVILGLSSKTYDKGAMYDSASTILVQKLSQIQGVGEVEVGGSSLPAVRVEINPLQLQHYGISLSDVATFLKNQNAHTPTGSISDAQTITYLYPNDQISKAADYRDLIVATKNGNAVRLRDVADVVDSTESTRSGGYVNGVDSVSLIVFKQPGSNIVQTVDRIKAQMSTLQASIPAGQKLTMILDQTTTIRSSLHEVEKTLIISVVFVVLVVFVFLRGWRSTIVPGIVVPASLVGTFAIMYLLGYSLDNLSLMALTISTGFVIDDAIVVMENITRYLEEGMQPLEAALKGAKEIGFTVLSITASLLAVFIPILFMGGVIGRLFREFAVTLSVAVMISMVLSLTTTPVLCSLLLRPHDGKPHGTLYRIVENAFERLLRGYERSLKWVLRDHSALVLVIFAVTIVLNVVYLFRISKGFFPQQDNGVVMGGVQGSQDASFAKMDKALKQSVAIVRSDPAVQNVVGFTGGGMGTSNSAFMFISLKPLQERHVSSTAVVNRLRPKLMAIKEAQTFLMAAQDLRVGGRQSNSQYQYTIQADTTADLRKYVPIITRGMMKLPALVDINSDMQAGGLESYLTYDRLSAARLGLTPSTIDDTLNYSFSQAQVSTIYKTMNQYHVVLEAQPQFTQGPDTFKHTFIENSSGTVPLDAVSTMQPRTAPLSVNHTGLYPSSTISFNLAQGVSLSEASAQVHALESSLHIPASVHGTFSGTAQQYQATLNSEPLLITTAIFAIYIVLGILYESLVHPITILTTLPSASLGAVITLVLFDTDLNIISIIGIILLIGIVKKNAIMMIDFALQMEREKGLEPYDAIFQACMLRFRPILMTSSAA
ncbi:MAG TPA: efflux RND transporter permease subunit, partial [Terracidiphilus sp.]|nr:efflux RND transporter permease subunit [Terracidiphilus sp.]